MATTTTNYGLTKPGYSDTADVADINENMDKIDGVLNYVSDAIGIVVDGDKTAYADGVEIGQFVILRNSTITGCDDGLYKAAKTIPYNTVIDSTYLTAEPSGAANALNASFLPLPDYSTTPVQLKNISGSGTKENTSVTIPNDGYYYLQGYYSETRINVNNKFISLSAANGQISMGNIYYIPAGTYTVSYYGWSSSSGFTISKI